MLNVFTQKTYATEVNRRIESDNDSTIDRDAFDGLRGKLTQAHMDEGVINNCRKCPVALAMNEMLAEHSEKIGAELLDVEVNKLFIYIFTGGYRKVAIIAEIDGLLDEWIRNFDEGKQLPPGEIYIEKDGLIDGIDGGKVQHWSVGIDVPDAYYNDPIGFEDNSVNWGV